MDINQFIRLKPIQEILRAVIWSGLVGGVGETPVSIMLIAPPQSCKTELLKHFNGTRSLKFFSDLTGKGLLPYKNDIESGRIRHVVLLDFIRVLRHPPNTTARLIAQLSSLMEEGESEAADAGGKTVWTNCPRIGLISAVTPEVYQGKVIGWRSIGFLSRFLSIKFVESDTAIKQVHHKIANGHTLPDPQPERLPDLPCAVDIPKKIAKELEHASIERWNRSKLKIQEELERKRHKGKLTVRAAAQLSKELPDTSLRFHRRIRTILKAETLRKGGRTPTASDLNKVLKWLPYLSGEETIEI
jgi:hypothetical protein